VLEGSGRLNASDWLQAFEDESPAVRRQALQLLAATLEQLTSPTRAGAGNDAPELEHGVWARSASLREAIGRRVAEEESQEVMWDILWVVTRFPEGERVPPLLTLLAKGNATIQSAALAASGNRMEELWAAWTRPGVVEDSSGGGRGVSQQQLDELLPRLARGLGLRGTRDDGNRVLAWVETPGAPRLKLAVANEFVEGNQGRGEVGAREGLRLTQAAEGVTRIAQDLVRHATEPVSDTTLDAGGSREQNVARNDIRERRNDFGTFDRWTLAEAVRWLGHSRDRAHNEVWLPSWITLVQRSMGEPVEGRVLEVLRRILAVDTPDLLRDVLPELQASTFRAVARHLMQRDEGAALLLDVMEQRRVLPSHLDISLMAQLRKHGNVELRARAIRFLGEPPGSRQEAIRRALPALSLAGDGVRGRTRFIERCQVCHPFRGEGQRVGPDLASVVANGAESLLVAILDPNRDVAPNYVEVVIETSENEVLSGLLLDGDIARIRLVTGGGEVRELLRATVRDLQITGRSLMPEGLEEGWSTQDLADLLAYLTAAPK
jgi:putative heme-binding domain-containing protein